MIGRKQNPNNKELELRIKTELVTDPNIIATELNIFFMNSVNEITQLYKQPNNPPCSVNLTQPGLFIDQITETEVANIIGTLTN